jgi:hypothetical protein
MGVMFALAGSLMARSLKRPAAGVLKGRVRRLLPPLWAFSAVVLVLMSANGWNPVKESSDGPTWGLVELINYIVPVGVPPFPWHIGSKSGLLEDTWAVQAAGPLWYLRAYLWFVVASPLLLWAFRRAPWPTLLAPLALTAIVGTGLVKIPGETGNAITDFAVYAGCWVLGFAHHDGLLKQIPRYVAVSCAFLLMAFGLWWASGHLGPDGWDLNDIPLGQATWSFGFVVILLQHSPAWRELPGRLAKWDKLVTLSNNRAVTIYLWHNMLIMATVPILDQLYELPFHAERACGGGAGRDVHAVDVRPGVAPDRPGDRRGRLDRGRGGEARAAAVAERHGEHAEEGVAGASGRLTGRAAPAGGRRFRVR